jgi:hypothetical protein
MVAPPAGRPRYGRERPVFFERDEKHRASAAQINDRASIGIVGPIEFFISQVRDMDHAFTGKNSRATRTVNGRIILAKFHVSLWQATRRNRAKFIPFYSSQHPECRLAQSHRLFEHRVENRGEVAGRRIDDAQYFGGRGLLFQGFARLCDQARVLHRDDRLRGEVLQQRDLLVGERADLLTVHMKVATQGLVLPQGDGEQGTKTTDLD